MLDFRPIFYIVGIFLTILAGFMTIPLIMDLYFLYGEWKAFAFSSMLCAFSGILLILGNKQDEIKITGKQAFLLTALSWIFLCLYAALPFLFAGDGLSFTDAVFESVSGLTTTGATIMTGLDYMPPSILLWRSLLQWIGGIGIIVMAISILPFLKVGGMQLFRLESSEKEKTVPRVTQLSTYIILIYFILSVLCVVAYVFSGMGLFDAINHAMTTISTGGFSTMDSSFSNHAGIKIELTAIFFMILGCLPFILYIKMLTGDWMAILRDQQAVAFLKTITIACAIIIFYLIFKLDSINASIIVEGIFTTTSLLSGTGYADTDYTQWGPFAFGFLLFISCIGGCAGSTSCGIKIFRFQILYAVAKNQMIQLIYPNGVFTIEYNNQPLTVKIAASVMAFFFIYIISIVFVTLLVLLCGVDFVTAISGAVATLGNVGPGLGNIIGPTGTYQPLPDTVKWIFIASMMLGRLEFFTLLVFFIPRFWRS